MKPPAEIQPFDDLTAEWPTPFPTHDAAVAFLKTQFRFPSNVRYFLDSLREEPDGYDFLFSRYAMAAINEYRQSWYHILDRIRCRVLFVRAAESWCLSREEAERMRSRIDNCTYFEVSGSDHMVYADNPDEFYPHFDRFLSSL
jgi:pimeloyl-ACP methyl ester carboxylesterase